MIDFYTLRSVFRIKKTTMTEPSSIDGASNQLRSAYINPVRRLHGQWNDTSEKQKLELKASDLSVWVADIDKMLDSAMNEGGRML